MFKVKHVLNPSVSSNGLKINLEMYEEPENE